MNTESVRPIPIKPQPDEEPHAMAGYLASIWYFGGQIHSFGSLVRKLSEIAPEGLMPVYSITISQWVWIPRE